MEKDLEKINNLVTDETNIKGMYGCLLSILDLLKLHDQGIYDENKTLSEKMFDIMEEHNININKELGLYLKPIKTIKDE